MQFGTNGGSWASSSARESSRLHSHRRRHSHHMRPYRRPRRKLHLKSKRPDTRLILYNEHPMGAIRYRIMLGIAFAALVLACIFTKGDIIPILLLFVAPLAVPVLAVIAILRMLGVVKDKPLHRKPDPNSVQYWE